MGERIFRPAEHVSDKLLISSNFIKYKLPDIEHRPESSYFRYIESLLIQIEKRYHNAFSHSLSGLRFIFNHFSTQQMV
jgi:hypothetical protein